MSDELAPIPLQGEGPTGDDAVGKRAPEDEADLSIGVTAEDAEDGEDEDPE